MFYVLTWVQMIPCRKPIRASCPFKLVQHFSHHADTWPKSLLGGTAPRCHSGSHPTKALQVVALGLLVRSWRGKMYPDSSHHGSVENGWGPFNMIVSFHFLRHFPLNHDYVRKGMVIWIWTCRTPVILVPLLQVSVDWFIQCQASWGKYDSHQRLVLTFPKS